MMEIEKYLLNIFLKISYFFAQLKCAYPENSSNGAAEGVEEVGN